MKDLQINISIASAALCIAAVACSVSYRWGKYEGYLDAKENFRRDAVEMGHAEFFVSGPQFNYERGWRWKKPCQ